MLRVMRKGHRGPDVGELRRRLAVEGSDVLTFDAAVEAAVRAFQLAHELPDTGIVDETTWTTIKQ